MRTTIHTPPHHVSDIEINISISAGSAAPTDSAAPTSPGDSTSSAKREATYEHDDRNVPSFGPKLKPNDARYLIHEMAHEYIGKMCPLTFPYIRQNCEELIFAIDKLYSKGE